MKLLWPDFVIISWGLPSGTARELILQAAALAIISVLVNSPPLLKLDGYWLLADLLDVPDIYRYTLDVLSKAKESRLRRWLLVLYVVLAALFGLGLLAAAVVVWTELFLGIITALWSSDWIGRLLGILLRLPLAGIIMQSLGYLINKRRKSGATRAA